METILNKSQPDSVMVAIVSDTHCDLDKRIIDLIRQADIAVHAGDIGDISVLDAMQPKSGRVIAVTGNNDHPVLWPAQQGERLESIPEIAEIELPGGLLAVEHGDRHGQHAPDHQLLRNTHPGARVIVYGHTHRMLVDDSHEPWVVNPGAAGKTRTRGGASCLLLDASSQGWKIEQRRFLDQDS